MSPTRINKIGGTNTTTVTLTKNLVGMFLKSVLKKTLMKSFAMLHMWSNIIISEEF